MTALHYLAGPCDGILILRDGDTITVEDETGREPRTIYTFASDDVARRAEWSIREELYRKYGERP